MPIQTIDVGVAAEAVRGFLKANGPVAAEWMYRELGLSRSLADRGVGWLAREGGLTVEKRARRREARTEKAAEAVARALHSTGPVSVARLGEVTSLPDGLHDQGVGWLAREGRVVVETKGAGHRLPLGEIAGRVWRLVRARGRLRRSELAAALGLPAAVVDQAIGWLMREGKLVFEDRRRPRPAGGRRLAVAAPEDSYSEWIHMKARLHGALGFGEDRAESRPVAMVSAGVLSLEKRTLEREVRIGEAAGRAWQALHGNGAMNVRQLSAETHMPAHLTDQAIGWLAREDKVSGAGDEMGLVALKS